MADAKTLPLPPEMLMKPERFARIGVVLLKKKLQSMLGSSFKDVRDEMRKTLGLTKQEAQEMMLYVIRLTRVALNEIVDDLEKRYSQPVDDEQ